MRGTAPPLAIPPPCHPFAFGRGGTSTRTTGPVTGYGGLCVDVRGASSANFTPVQAYTCNGTGAQQRPSRPATPCRRSASAGT